MTYDYNDVFSQVFTLPLGIIIVTLFALVWNTVKFIKKKSYKSKKDIFFYCLLILIVVIFIFNQAPFLSKHGIHLLSENETNKIVNTGVVDGLYKSGGRVPHMYATIDGQEYYFRIAGDIKVGDTITFEYLPKSKVILSWSKS